MGCAYKHVFGHSVLDLYRGESWHVYFMQKIRPDLDSSDFQVSYLHIFTDFLNSHFEKSVFSARRSFIAMFSMPTLWWAGMLVHNTSPLKNMV